MLCSNSQLLDDPKAIDLSDVYSRPRTYSVLVCSEGGEMLTSREGPHDYPMRHGIPCFLERAPVESHATTDQVDESNHLCKLCGWAEALWRVHGKDSGFVRYVTDPNRCIYLRHIPVTPDSTVLEIGPGLGQFTCAIAPRVKRLYALEVVPGQAEFAAERCRQSGFTNVSVACGGDDCRLPYRSQCFDAVVCNLVLEWCATRSQLTPLLAQKRLIAEVSRVLKPGGYLYVATKNRFALRYLFGGADEHLGGMRFGSALPRWVSASALRLAGKPASQALVHSFSSLSALLRSQGFVVESSFWAAPEFRHPQRMVSNEASSVREARKDPQFVT
jgi:SAM-dependent methyltransferase